MQLASMVHAAGRDREVYDHRQHQQFYAPPARHHPVDVAAAAHHHYPPQHQPDYLYRTPQSPPSPPVEEANKPSLPSISSLLGIADGERANPEAAGMSPHQSQQQLHSPSAQPPPQNPMAAQQPESRPDQAPHAFGPAIVSNPRMTLPPTPPMQPESVVDGNQSPSAASTQSSVAPQPYYLGQSLNNMEPHHQRQHVPNPAMVKRHSLPSQQSMSPYNASPYVTSPYASSPGAASTGSFYSPENHPYPAAGMYQQRPLPSNFAPQQMPMPAPSNPSNAGNLWQHHHYISQSSQSAFPQSPDRYICPTCNKAFSRPSSLRIHSHSHTGEKPYKCPQPGCGKAFSVRSNMKRHERGCHAAANVISSS